VKDSELRGIVLRFLYDHRREDVVLFGLIQGATEIPESVDQKDWLRACGHLSDYNLIEWDPFIDHTGDGVLGGAAKINAFRTDVVEGSREPPIPMVLDQRQYINVISSQAVQIAGANSQQQQSLADTFEKVVNALDNANVSEAEKNKARSILVTLLESKAATAILGPIAGEIIKRIVH
jgi:hypothetical protein